MRWDTYFFEVFERKITHSNAFFFAIVRRLSVNESDSFSLKDLLELGLHAFVDDDKSVFCWPSIIPYLSLPPSYFFCAKLGWYVAILPHGLLWLRKLILSIKWRVNLKVTLGQELFCCPAFFLTKIQCTRLYSHHHRKYHICTDRGITINLY